MKITEVEPIHIAVPYRFGGPTPQGPGAWRKMETLLVRVATDGGVTGWGEAFGFGACATTKIAVSSLVAPLSVGRDIGDHMALMGELRRALHNYGADGAVSFALSGLDIALWDIAGKLADMPIYRMLGGDRNLQRIPAYASLLRYGDATLAADNAGEAAARGYRQIKLHEIGFDEIAAARHAIGAEIDLMVDTNCAWSENQAINMARRLRPLNLTWIEEPVWPPSDLQGLARVRREGGIPVAAGENAGTLAAFEQLLDLATVDYLQPSVTKVGGLTEMLKIIAAAEKRNVPIAPHSPYFGPGLIATVHLLAAGKSGRACERFYCDLEASPFGEAIQAKDGWMRIPEGAGLGVDVDEKVIARYRIA